MYTPIKERKSLDQRLKKLVEEAQQHPPKSPERQLKLQQLVTAIMQSNQLCRPFKGRIPGVYEDVYAEALQKLFCHICERIEEYNPSKGEVLQWVNFLLEKRFFLQAYREITPANYETRDSQKVIQLKPDELEQEVTQNDHSQLMPSLSQEIIQYLQEDPEGIFRGTHVAKYPKANFQYLTLRRIAGYSWKEIATELGMKIPTLSCFYRSCLIKFAPKFKGYLLQ